MHLAVTTQHIMDKAEEVIKPVNEQFKSSRGWAQKFMRRNNLTIRAKTSLAQKLPAALEAKMNDFLTSVKAARKATNYTPDLIGNMD